MPPYPAIDAPVLQTEGGTPFLQEPGVVLVAMPATDLRGIEGFLRGFEPALGFGAYLDDPVALPPAERLVKLAGQVCFDERTEILTDEGWSRFAELRAGQAVLTMNPSTLAVEYQTPSAVHAYPYAGDLLCAESPDISFAVTPDHRQFGYFTSHSAAERGFIVTDAIRGRSFAVFTAPSGWAGEVPEEVGLPGVSSGALAAAGASRGQAASAIAGCVYRTGSDVAALAQLIAHHATDGSADIGAGHGALRFCGDRAAAAGELCEGLGLTQAAWRDPRTGATGLEVDGAGAAYVATECGPTAGLRQFPRWVLNLPQDVLSLVWEALARPDGAAGGRGREALVTPSVTLAGQAQEILCKLGYASSLVARPPEGGRGGLPVYEVRKKTPRPAVLNRSEADRIRARPYAGTVYCVTTDNGVVCVRRDGKVHFSGNCYASFGPRRTPNSQAGKYLLNIKSSGHGSVLEHAAFSLLLYGVSRSLTHELVRHRAGTAVSQLSQRYVSGRVLRFVERPEYRDDPELHELFVRRIDAAAAAYDRLSELLLARQKAGTEILSAEARTDLRKKVQQCSRSLLPNETEAPLVMTANVRAWRHIIEMRANPHAEVEIRALAFRVYRVLRQAAPLLFGDYEERHLPDGTWAVESPYLKV